MIMEIDMASELYAHFGISMKIGSQIYVYLQKNKGGDV